MKYPTRLSDAVHILAFIALYPDCDLTSNKLAESVQTNPAYVRQLMSALRKGGLLISVKGHPRPALAREPEKITMLDAYRAVEGNKPLLHQDIHTNPACGVGVNIQLVLRDFYLDIQKTAEQRMQGITLKDVLEQYHMTPIGYPCPFAKRMRELVQKEIGDGVRILDYTHDAGPEPEIFQK